MLVCVIAFQQLISKACWLLASVFQAASLTPRLLSPTGRGQSLRRVFSRHSSPGILSRRRRLVERLPSAKRQALRVLLHRSLCKMPHVTAYGIVAVQALFVFLGGIRQRSNHHAPIGRLLYAQVSATTS